MSGTIWPKNWQEFQHYKDRRPPWIKLHRTLLENFEFHQLQDASKALALCLWILASEYEEAKIPLNIPELSWRLHIDASKLNACINDLINKGFFCCDQSASAALSRCKQDAMPETEAERETEGESPPARKTKVPKEEKRATRLPPDWLLTQELIEEGKRARTEADLPMINFSVEASSFRDYWHSKGGKDATKADWTATWRNWCRKSYSNGKGIDNTHREAPKKSAEELGL